jgi:hypothetical protein
MLFYRTLSATNISDADTLATLQQRALPRLHFHSSFWPSILNHRKQITIRLVSDKELDTDSDLDRIYPHAIVTAITSTSHSEQSQPKHTRALLRIHAMDLIAFQELNGVHAENEGFESVSLLQETLRRFYPTATPQTRCVVLSFQFLGLLNDTACF